MIRLSVLTLAVLALLPLTGILYAQDATPPNPPAPPTTAPPQATKATPGPQLMEFQKKFEQWKKILTQLQSMRSEYVAADEDKQKELKAKYDKLVEEATALQPQLTKSAEKAYVENPKADPQIEQFLKAFCVDSFMVEDFEECYRVAKLLLDQGVDDEAVNLTGGAAAFCTNHLDEAEKLLKKATEDGTKPIRTAPNKQYLDITLNQFLASPSTFKKAWAKEKEIRDKEAKADDLPRVLLKTSAGDIVIELFENEAPNTVANFVSLVEKGFYDGLTF
ncbi:MAG: peptidylprolyl isomerase, partial [Planctomycetia bacterium]